MGTRATAQTSAYQPPGTLATPKEILKTRLMAEYREARWRIGPLRVQPWFSVSDLGYTNDVAGAVGSDDRRPDSRVTLGLGAKLYGRAGNKIYLSTYFLPQYHWYAKTPSLRTLAGRYGTGLFGFFNRLTLMATLARRTTEAIRTPEVLRPALFRKDEGRLSADLRVTGPVSLVVEVSGMSVRDEEDSAGSSLKQLDRDETVASAGIRYEATGRLSLAAMAVHTRSLFSTTGCRCDNSGTSPRIEVVYAANPLRMRLDVSWRDLKPDAESLLPSYRRPTWRFSAYLDRGTRLSYSVYTKRDLFYATGGEPAFLEHDLAGGALRFRLGHRTSAKAYLETGADNYLGGVSRRDRFAAFGLDAAWMLPHATVLAARLGTIRYRSDLPGVDRNVSVISFGFSFGGDFATPW